MPLPLEFTKDRWRCPLGDDDRKDAGVEKLTEDRKFRFCSNNRGGNLTKRAKNRTGVGEKGTSELCPDRRGKFEVRKGERISGMEVRMLYIKVIAGQVNGGGAQSCWRFRLIRLRYD